MKQYSFTVISLSLVTNFFKVPLHSAVCGRTIENSWEAVSQEQLIRAMIEKGADIKIKDREGDNLVMMIIQSHNEEMALSLIKVLAETIKGDLHRLVNDPIEAFVIGKGIAVVHILVEKKFFRIIKYLKENAGLTLNMQVRLYVKVKNFSLSLTNTRKFSQPSLSNR